MTRVGAGRCSALTGEVGFGQTGFNMRGALVASVCLMASVVPSLALAKATNDPRPPRGLYRFNGFNEGVGPDRPGGAPGSLTVNHGGTSVSKVSFTFPATDATCVTKEPASGTVLVKIKGTFPITAGRGQDHGYWVVGVNGNGARGKRATFTVGTQPPVQGTIALFFYSEPPEVASFVMHFGGCTANGGDFGR
jgi:hypothetical protein